MQQGVVGVVRRVGAAGMAVGMLGVPGMGIAQSELPAKAMAPPLAMAPAMAMAMAAPPSTPAPATLPAINVQAGSAAEERAAFNPVTPPQVNKSTFGLNETPQSITVVPRAVLDSQQAQSLADALRNVPGVVAQTFGRRGWDDLIIRGQVASDALFLDGLRTGANNRVAEELYGIDRVEVVKGPASLLYGQVLPGGLVNMVSKRPQASAFADADLTVGSYGLRQGTIDLGRPLSENGKAAFRLNGLVMNSDDPTDAVYFRTRHIAPSLSFDLGPRTDFTLLASYQEREYLRQQGLPLSGSVYPNVNGRLPLDRFTAEPGQKPYRAYQSRVGYALTHRFDSGWTLRQTVRRQDYTMSGQFVTNTSLAANSTSLRRGATDQAFNGATSGIDTHVQRVFATRFGTHELTLGNDYIHTEEATLQKTCTVANLNVYNPVYGSPVVCPATYRTDNVTTIRSLGVYARDQVRFGERWTVVSGLRRDQTATYTTNNLNGGYQSNPASKTTGSAAVMVEVARGVRPYVSYATSFYPNTGTDVQARLFAPESGRQWEAGVKVDLDDGATAVTLAAFDLRRRNVLQADPLNTGYNLAIGEQRTRGAELGLASDLRNGLSLFGGYAFTAGEITEDGAGAAATTVGQPLNNVARHHLTVSGRYRFSNALRGWELNAGVRGEAKRYAYGYELPGYMVGDVGVGYTADAWRAALTIRNVLDQRYYAGGLAAAVAAGNPRTVMLTVGYRYR